MFRLIFPARFLLFQVPAVLCALLLAAGCASKGTMVAHTFDSSPGDWLDLTPAGGENASAGPRVKSHYLGVSGTRILMEPSSFESVNGIVDLAVAGGSAKGFAGVFLKRTGDDYVYCLAQRTRGTGEFRYYAARDPLRPGGGSGWQPTSRKNPAGYARISFEFVDGRLRFSLDDKRYTPDFDSTLSQGRDGGLWQVGIFSMELDTRWNNFIVSDNSAPGGLLEQVDWGDRSAAMSLDREFTQGAGKFIDKPTRSGIFALTAALSGAERIYRHVGAAADGKKLLSRATEILGSLKVAARSLGEEELLVRCFAIGVSSESDRREVLGAGKKDFVSAGKSASGRESFSEAAVYYAAALSLDENAATSALLEAVKMKIPTPSYSLEIDEDKVKNRVVAQSRFRAAVQQEYGGLPREEDADLEIRVRINRSSATRDSEDATRRIPIVVDGEGMSIAERREMEKLEEELPEFLLDAKARAEVRRVSSKLGGRNEAFGALAVYTIGAGRWELHIDDGKRAMKDHARLEILRSKWKGLEKKLSYEEVQAERTIVSINFVAEVDFIYKGKTLAANEEIKAYRGLVLWRHDAVENKGIAASIPSTQDIRPAAEAVRRRVLGQFSGHVSKAKLLASLGRVDRLALLLRLARASGNNGDVLNLKWYLGKDFGFKEALCDEVSKRLLN